MFPYSWSGQPSLSFADVLYVSHVQVAEVLFCETPEVPGTPAGVTKGVRAPSPIDLPSFKEAISPQGPITVGKSIKWHHVSNKV
jgi:hypothetical protein